MALEGEVVDEVKELPKEERKPLPPALIKRGADALAPATDIEQILSVASAQASAIMKVIEEKHLSVRIGSGKHILIEAWTALAQANRKRFDTIELRVDDSPNAYTVRACVGLRDIDTGELVAKAWASCSKSEKLWKDRDDYAVESMAQTRAAGKVARLVYGWVIALAGYSATPAEEVVGPNSLDADQRSAYEAAWKNADKDMRNEVLNFLREKGYQKGGFIKGGVEHYPEVMGLLGVDVAP